MAEADSSAREPLVRHNSISQNSFTLPKKLIVCCDGESLDIDNVLPSRLAHVFQEPGQTVTRATVTQLT